MRKHRESKPLLHVFLCDAAAYKQGDLIGGWLTLPASEEEIKRYLLRFSGQHLITNYDLMGSCLLEEWVQEVVLCCQNDVKKLSGYIAGKGKTQGKKKYVKRGHTC